MTDSLGLQYRLYRTVYSEPRAKLSEWDFAGGRARHSLESLFGGSLDTATARDLLRFTPEEVSKSIGNCGRETLAEINHFMRPIYPEWHPFGETRSAKSDHVHAGRLLRMAAANEMQLKGYTHDRIGSAIGAHRSAVFQLLRRWIRHEGKFDGIERQVEAGNFNLWERVA